MKMDMEDADMTLWTEAEFEEKCTYIVNDHPWDCGADGARAGTEPGAQKELNKIVDWQMRAKIDLLEIAVPKTRFESLFFLFFVLQKKIIILIF